MIFFFFLYLLIFNFYKIISKVTKIYLALERYYEKEIKAFYNNQFDGNAKYARYYNIKDKIL